jgi:AsmA family/AsmA-like C-terminal region
MTVDAQGRRRTRTRVWVALSAVAAIVALLIVPPYVSVSRYKNRISQVLAASIGRPVRLSSVELRILPRPSFVLTDLVVEEDPAYGAEPVLHANAVTASIRILPLWRGRLEISRISVDEASLNLVRTVAGRWNLDPFLRSAAGAGTGGGSGSGRAIPLPYLEATNSRVNVKNGVEKLPYSLVNADLSVWQESPGAWRVRLRGQPARTDVSLDLADTGVVRLEASLRRAPELRQMPVHIDLEWREAQLGQLSRLVLGSDEGWRGDLTGEAHLDGTADAAQVKARLRASGVHRAEFAPASAMDFDASCGFVYHYSTRGLEKLLCDSPVGDGRARLTGEVPGQGGEPQLSLEMDRVPAQMGLDALRTLRRGLDPSLQVAGTMSGQIRYSPAAVSTGTTVPRVTGHSPRAGTRMSKAHPLPAGPLSGAISLTALRISGDGLSKPIQAVKVTIEPAAGPAPALTATAAIPAGAPLPLNVTARLTLSDYQLGVHGPAALPRLREMARLAGIPNNSLLDNINGQPALVDLSADGPWLPAPTPLAEALPFPASAGSTAGAAKSAATPAAPAASGSDRMSGTVILRTATWKADFLALPVEITAATLRLDNTGQRWDPVEFRYGPVRGTAMVQLPPTCDPGQSCTPTFGIRFEALDSAALEAAILGARQSNTLLSNLLARLRPENAPGWPELEGTVQAGELTLGPVTLSDVAASLRIGAAGTEIQALDAELLEGRMHATGSVTPGAKPVYKLEGSYTGLNAAGTGQLLGMTWAGNGLEGTGQIELSGFTGEDLGSSAKGTLHFDWRHGSVSEANDVEFPPVLTRFDRWTADAEIANGAITLKQNQVQRGVHKLAVAGSAVFGDPPKVSFGSSPEVRAAKR